MTNTATAVNNGVNVEALLGAREALTEAPEAAKFVWRAESEWKSGTHTESKVEKFFGLGEEQSHTREFSYDTDHPRSSQLKTTVRRPSSSYSSASLAA